MVLRQFRVPSWSVTPPCSRECSHCYLKGRGYALQAGSSAGSVRNVFRSPHTMSLTTACDSLALAEELEEKRRSYREQNDVKHAPSPRHVCALPVHLRTDSRKTQVPTDSHFRTYTDMHKHLPTKTSDQGRAATENAKLTKCRLQLTTVAQRCSHVYARTLALPHRVRAHSHQGRD